MSDSVIVKIERRLFPRNLPAKIYDRSRSLVVETHLSEDIKLKMGGDTIGYFNATKANNKWQVGSLAAKQPW